MCLLINIHNSILINEYYFSMHRIVHYIYHSILIIVSSINYYSCCDSKYHIQAAETEYFKPPH